ncbi:MULTISPECIES: hypothetical protein [Burkholderia]|uniref:hypothetical protein n=1 Tax=Burkholderia TaxID=32008 RepID=UPI00126989FC|nr:MULTISPECIES: hypothetical protein [Burkholderia]
MKSPKSRNGKPVGKRFLLCCWCVVALASLGFLSRLPILDNMIMGGAVWLSSGYISRPLTLDAMLADMGRRKNQPDSRYDRLWYLGTKNGQHYFKHIRGYFMGDTYYRVSANKLHISTEWPYSTDSDNWGIVDHIDSRWRTADKENDLWHPNPCIPANSHWRCIEITG